MRRWLALALIGAAWSAAPVMAQPASQACRVACRISQANPSPDQRHCLAQCAAGQSITREAPGQARPSGIQATGPGAPVALTGAARPTPPASQRANPVRPSSAQAMSAGRAGPTADADADAAAAGSFGAVYLAIPPNMAYGMVVGQRDRLTAHRLAEGACRASGANCVMAEDLLTPCAAVAEGVRRAPGAFFMTSDPKTYIVRAITFRSAGNRADAERDALEVCRQRERGALTCRIVQAQCGGR